MQSTTHVRVFAEDRDRLMALKSMGGFRAASWVIHKLLEERVKNIATASQVMKDRVPVVLTGPPLSGKSHFTKNTLLPSLQGKPVLLVDIWDEYKEIFNAEYNIYSLRFNDYNNHIRFIPNKQSKVAMTEIDNVFSHLDMKRNQLSKWTVIVEEAHAFKDISAFTKFLYGSRHIVRKMIAITPQTDAFTGLITLTVPPRSIDIEPHPTVLTDSVNTLKTPS